MRVAVHTPDKTRYANLALMKLSAWHKSLGDTVEWFSPLFSSGYDVVYSSKVFTFTPDDIYLPDSAIRGGTGYGHMSDLPEEIEHMCPDYSLYPSCDHALGFLTRGCIRSCDWCIVPEKEGFIRANAFYEEFVRSDTRDIVFMDNNVLASSHGLSEIERLGRTDYRVDFNQGLDARLIASDEGVAELLSDLKWYKPLRLACDKKSQMPFIESAVNLLRKHKCTPSWYNCYVLVKDIEDAYERVMFLKGLKMQPFAQPYRDFKSNIPPTDRQRRFARWVNHKQCFNTMSWSEYEKKRGDRI